MNIFLDTSSLFKLYHKEDGTEELMAIFNNHSITGIYLAEITLVELKVSAQNLLHKHWNKGLRTLDALQLSSALVVKNEIQHFFTANHVLSEIAKFEGFDVK